ncbi:hypothetical protein K08M3_14320 [Vibrio alginolyticus]|uniref:Uncharacterized protein n=1 Tax=Vibrio alginolyticus TaxID=663 RepID=A0A1W6UK93_VIBAL|nr:MULTISPECIES: hypothetical protein [Vibrio]ARO98372.1 hypothetical protein K01M1_14290 [Vibrio alginolyticus]ARP03089.1 hypothetical protein K04M1_14410 [Vibrio alginolyticus]ARP08147.1 hypothetical protein K04M3_14440 [Vibrio alginolyticus]ARP13209.1 hypothetical protein K04M5_14090 [Vibrio alginolyticus]ARP18269.1 hypothetical protein K05K4_14330 [Vibrio alginolyticus]
MSRIVFTLATILAVSLVFSSDSKEAYVLIESATPGILGAILGGLTAGISIIFSVLLTSASAPNSKVELGRFKGFLSSLRKDIICLLLCLVASLLLPYLRVTGIPLLSYPVHELVPSRDMFYTAVELAVIAVSVAIIIEVFNVMFTLFSHFATLFDNKDS